MKNKKGCTSCKKKPANKITTLKYEMTEDLQKAYEYTQIASQMKGERMDLIEEVWKDITGHKYPLNRTCRSCVQGAVKIIQNTYKEANR